MATIGFIGLGLMGQGFVERLIANGHTVIDQWFGQRFRRFAPPLAAPRADLLFNAS